MAGQVEMTPEEWRKKFGLSPVKPGAAGVSANGVVAALMEKKPSKYGNITRVYQGVRYHSKAELAFEMHLRMLQRLGKVTYWLRQVPFCMPADDNTERVERYLLDFEVHQPPAPAVLDALLQAGLAEEAKALEVIRLVDVKGFFVGKSKTKIATIQATYHVKIETPRAEDIETWI